MKIPILTDIEEKVRIIKILIDELSPEIQNFRNYYKHQSTNEDLISESIIGSWGYLKEVDNVLYGLDEIKAYEE